MPRKNIVNIQIGADWWELFQIKFPELAQHGRNYATECLYANALGLHTPKTPSARINEGAKNRWNAPKTLTAKSRKKKT